MAYSIDFRRKVVSVYEKKKSLRKTAELFGISYTFVQEMVKRSKAGEPLDPKPHKSGNLPRIQDVHIPFLMDMIENENDLTLDEMCQCLYEKFNLKIASSTLCESLKRLKISRKKNFSRSSGGQRRKFIKNSKLPCRAG